MTRGTSGRRAARRRRRHRRQALAAGAVVLVLATGTAGYLLTRGGDDQPAVAIAPVATTGAPVPPTVAPAVVVTAPPPTTVTEPDPGNLPQTQDKPTSTSPKFTAGVAALWQAIVADDPIKALPFFFPLGAYRQVKAISNPESDWRSRLVSGYVDDIHALHAKLGAKAATAQLVGMDVPDGQAVWVQPGVEYNKGSYWRVYGAQLRYTADGQSGSFPIASMISWRGEWYVVHLNSIR